MSNQAEKTFGMVPTDHDREKLKEVIPKIRVVEGDEEIITRAR